MSNKNDQDVIGIVGKSEGGECGYCKKSFSDKSSFGMICDNMKPETYLNLMDRGWRRCGSYFYKPLNEKTCCPSYTIRTDVTQGFELSKSQRRVLKRFRKFLQNGKTVPAPKPNDPEKINARGDEVSKRNLKDNTTKHSPAVEQKDGETVKTKTDKSRKAKTLRFNLKLEKLTAQSLKTGRPFNDISAEYEKRRQQRLKKRQRKTLAQLLDYSDLHQPKHVLKVRTVRCHPESGSFRDTKKAEHAVYVRYQCTVHGDSPSDVGLSQFERFLVDGGLQGNRVDFGDELKEEHSSHGKKNKNNSKSKLPSVLPLGQFHQQYWLDGQRLIAVGVIDIVPRAVSSVYLFYDPDFSFLNLGVYSALSEIDFTNRLRSVYEEQDFTLYYMGFYIHDCLKMRYKAQYFGSMLLCPVAYSWVPVVICQQILDQWKFRRFSSTAERDRLSLNEKSINQLSSAINVVVSGKSFKLTRFMSRLSTQFLEELELFAHLVGSRVLSTIYIRLA